MSSFDRYQINELIKSRINIQRPKLSINNEILSHRILNKNYSAYEKSLFALRSNYKLVLTSLGYGMDRNIFTSTNGFILMDPYLDNNFNLIFQKEIELIPYITPSIANKEKTIHHYILKFINNDNDETNYELLKSNIYVRMVVKESYIAKYKHSKKIKPTVINIEELIKDQVERERSIYSNYISLNDITKDTEEINKYIITTVMSDIVGCYLEKTGVSNNSNVYSYIFDKYFAIPDKEEEINWMEKYVPHFFKLYKKMIENEINETMGHITHT